jgi:hypothetical protein
MTDENDGKIDYYAMVEDAWNLSDAAREFAKTAGRELAQDDYWEPVFASHALVDVERTKKEGGQPLARIFLKSPYGLQYRTDHKDWIPFRHAEIDITKMATPKFT